MPAAFPITGIAHVGLRVAELERSRQFYERLGFQFVLGPIGPEPVAILSHPAGIELNLILNAAQLSEPNVLMDIEVKHAGYTHIALQVDDLDVALAWLAELRVPLSGGPVTYPNLARGLFIRDPDRNVIEFHQPAP